MRADPALLQSYLDAHYLVTLPDGAHIQLLIGHPAPQLDDQLAAGTRFWAVLHPGNARSAPWPDRLNAARLQTLQRLLHQRGLDASPAESHAADGSWSERGVLLTACNIRDVDQLACRFGQHAVVTGGPGQVATLRHYGPQWRALH